ncbi:MAG: transcription factor FapR [Clostridia bacterium]|nr:transcription factor FapR [Clostridia bacterium]
MSSNKQQRRRQLARQIEKNPFLTDEELAELFFVSVPTIRLDRMELGIAQHRERVKQLAASSKDKITSLQQNELVGEIIDIQPGQRAVSVMETDRSMVFQKSKVVRGSSIYAMAETLCIAAVGVNSAIVGIANIKYKEPVYAGTQLVAKAEVKRQRGAEFIVWVMIYRKDREVFRGKFILVPVDETA